MHNINANPIELQTRIQFAVWLEDNSLKCLMVSKEILEVAKLITI